MAKLKEKIRNICCKRVMRALGKHIHIISLFALAAGTAFSLNKVDNEAEARIKRAEARAIEQELNEASTCISLHDTVDQLKLALDAGITHGMEAGVEAIIITAEASNPEGVPNETAQALRRQSEIEARSAIRQAQAEIGEPECDLEEAHETTARLRVELEENGG